MTRVVLGFLLAPILPMAPFIVMNLIAYHSFQGAGPFLVVGILYAYPVMLVVGVPLYIHAKRQGVFTFARTVKAAALTGTVVGMLVPLSFISRSTMAVALAGALVVGLIGALVGAAVGFSFWLIAGGNSERAGADP